MKDKMNVDDHTFEIIVQQVPVDYKTSRATEWVALHQEQSEPPIP